MIKPESNVYFARCVTIDGVDMGAVKVGLAYDVDQRVSAVGANAPYKCELICSTPGDMFLEYFVHMWLREDAISGEYFKHGTEAARLIDAVQKTGKLPFPIKFVSGEGWFADNDCVAYMERKGITFADINKHSGVTVDHYKKLVEKQRCGNRRFLAALAVTAVKMGHTIHWSRDFKPPKAERIAA